MRKILLLLVILSVSVIAPAQITTRIWGLRLGSSTKSQVTNVIKAHNLQIRDQGTDYITCSSPSSFKFGGEAWNYAKFRFFDGKLYNVSFSYSCQLSVKESFDRLKNSLNKKYFSYITDKDLETYGDWYIDYNDGSTTVSITYNIEQGHDFVGIMYYDNRLMLKSIQESESEL